MRLVTVTSRDDGREWIGVIREGADGRIVDLARGAAATGAHAAEGFFSSMLALIEAGEPGLEAARTLLARAERGNGGGRGANWGAVDPASVHLRTPLPNPPQVRDCLIFEDHLKNSFTALRRKAAAAAPDPEAALREYEAKGLYTIPPVWYQIPIYYKCNRNSVIGGEEDIVWPAYSDLLDFELELGCFIGARTKDVDEEEAERRIFGYSIFNDMSARDTQSVEMQGMLGPTKSKDFDTGNIIGPCIATADSVDIGNLTMVARVNGEEWARGNSGSAYWSFGKVISYMSRSETLVPGEFIGSGTVGGGCGLELDRFLQPGDVIELEVEGIGVLRNRVTRPPMTR